MNIKKVRERKRRVKVRGERMDERESEKKEWIREKVGGENKREIMYKKEN